jgi:hypothetical protein
MATALFTVGKLVLSNLDTIISVVKPMLTRKKVDALPSQTDLINQQISELQTAASNNADQIKAIASQLKEVVAAIDQAATSALVERNRTQKLALAAIAIAAVSICVAIASFVVR